MRVVFLLLNGNYINRLFVTRLEIYIIYNTSIRNDRVLFFESILSCQKKVYKPRQKVVQTRQPFILQCLSKTDFFTRWFLKHVASCWKKHRYFSTLLVGNKRTQSAIVPSYFRMKKRLALPIYNVKRKIIYLFVDCRGWFWCVTKLTDPDLINKVLCSTYLILFCICW